jgi:integrase
MTLTWPTHFIKKLIAGYNAAHAENPLPYVTCHGLRHTSATLAISQNIDIKTVSKRLGHAQTSTTMNIYAHALEELDRKAAAALETVTLRKQA